MGTGQPIVAPARKAAMGGSHPGNWRAKHPAQSCPHYLLKLTVRKAHAARVAYQKWHNKQAIRYRRLYEKWRCIHEHEGAWNAHNPPYHGGLQFDETFQAQYGPEFMRRWGDAGNWPVWAQLEAAERAYHGFRGWAARGFGPWPNTRRMCGV